MARTRRAPIKPRKPEIPVRSVRIGDATWDPAVERATREGYTMSAVMATFVDLYGRELLDMPKVELVVSQPRAE